MKNPEKQWIKKVDAAIILVMRRCLRNYLLIFLALKRIFFQHSNKCICLTSVCFLLYRWRKSYLESWHNVCDHSVLLLSFQLKTVLSKLDHCGYHLQEDQVKSCFGHNQTMLTLIPCWITLFLYNSEDFENKKLFLVISKVQ